MAPGSGPHRGGAVRYELAHSSMSQFGGPLVCDNPETSILEDMAAVFPEEATQIQTWLNARTTALGAVALSDGVILSFIII